MIDVAGRAEVVARDEHARGSARSPSSGIVGPGRAGDEQRMAADAGVRRGDDVAAARAPALDHAARPRPAKGRGRPRARRAPPSIVVGRAPRARIAAMRPGRAPSPCSGRLGPDRRRLAERMSALDDDDLVDRASARSRVEHVGKRAACCFGAPNREPSPAARTTAATRLTSRRPSRGRRRPAGAAPRSPGRRARRSCRRRPCPSVTVPTIA